MLEAEVEAEAEAEAVESHRVRRDALLESARSYRAPPSEPSRPFEGGWAYLRAATCERNYHYGAGLTGCEEKKESSVSIHTFDSLRQRGTQDFQDFLTGQLASWPSICGHSSERGLMAKSRRMGSSKEGGGGDFTMTLFTTKNCMPPTSLLWSSGVGFHDSDAG